MNDKNKQKIKNLNKDMIMISALFIVAVFTFAIASIHVFAEETITSVYTLEQTSNTMEVIDIKDEDCSNTMEVEFCEASLKCKNERNTLKCICKVYPEWRGCSVLSTTTTTLNTCETIDCKPVTTTTVQETTTTTTIKELGHDNIRWGRKNHNTKVIIKPKVTNNCRIEIERVTWIVPNTFAYLSAEIDRDKCLAVLS